MNMFNNLPYFVILQGKKIKINVDFRNMIFFENKAQDKTISKSDLIKIGLQSFYPDFFYILNNQKILDEACEKFIWFYKCGRENYHKSSASRKK